jgi:peptide/nickel transport system permease protein
MHLTITDWGYHYEGSEGYEEYLKEKLGLDKPIHVQYLVWLQNLAQGNFGRSMITQSDVLEEMVRRLPVTLRLTLAALAVNLVVGLGLGILSALYQYSLFDVVTTVISFLFLSLPGFFFLLLAIWVFAFRLGWLPGSGMYTIGGEGGLWDSLKHMILPVTVLGLGGSAVFIRFARTSMLEVMGEDYVRTARAKGLPERLVIVRHAFRNALMPIVTIISYRLPALFAGSVLVERLSNWPGIGRWVLDGALSKDYPVMMANVFVIAILTLIANLLADIAYAFVDPRIAYN